MKKLTSLEELIKHLKNHPLVIAYQALEKALLNHETYQTRYQTFLTLQKKLVQEKKYSKDYEKLKIRYQEALEALENDPLIYQYLTLQEELNTFLKSLTELTQEALNEPFKD